MGQNIEKALTLCLNTVQAVVLNNCLHGAARPKVQPLPFYIPFSMKKVSLSPFEYLLLTNDTPLKYHVWNFAFLLTAVNALSFK